MGLTFGCDTNNIVRNKELYSFNIGIGAIIDTNMRAAPWKGIGRRTSAPLRGELKK